MKVITRQNQEKTPLKQPINIQLNKNPLHENNSQELDKMMAALKNLLENKAWKSISKSKLKAPQGVRQLLKIVNDKHLSFSEKILNMHAFLGKHTKVKKHGNATLYSGDKINTYLYVNLFLKLDTFVKRLPQSIKDQGIAAEIGSIIQATVAKLEQTKQQNTSPSAGSEFPLPAPDLLAGLEAKHKAESRSGSLGVQSTNEQDLFKLINKLLIDTRKIVNSNQWDKTGRNLLFMGSKCPETINKLRKWSSDINVCDPNKLTAFEKFELLVKFTKIYHSLENKSLDKSKPPIFRQEKTHEFYKTLTPLYQTLSSMFPKSVNDMLHKINKDVKNKKSILKTFEKLGWDAYDNVVFKADQPIISDEKKYQLQQGLRKLDAFDPLKQANEDELMSELSIKLSESEQNRQYRRG